MDTNDEDGNRRERKGQCSAKLTSNTRVAEQLIEDVAGRKDYYVKTDLQAMRFIASEGKAERRVQQVFNMFVALVMSSSDATEIRGYRKDVREEGEWAVRSSGLSSGGGDRLREDILRINLTCVAPVLRS